MVVTIPEASLVVFAKDAVVSTTVVVLLVATVEIFEIFDTVQLKKNILLLYKCLS